MEESTVDSTAWNVQTSTERVTADVQDTAGANDIIPGIYGAIVRVIRRRPTAGFVSSYNLQTAMAVVMAECLRQQCAQGE